jgi:Oxidoreductase molybdopterin binding domain
VAKLIAALALALALALGAEAQTIELVDPAGKAHAIGLEDLKKLPPREVTAKDPHGKEPSLYRGTALWEVLSLTGAPLESPLDRDALASTVRIEATDRYQVAFSLAELDPQTGSSDVLLVWERDGKPLDAPSAPFRLVVPTDKRGARWVRQVVRIRVGD